MNVDFISELTLLGMTKREAEIYSAMMSKPEWKAGEIQQVTGISRVLTHQLLEQMAAHNFCTKRSEGRFSYYRPTPPNILMDLLNEHWETELTRRQEHANSLLGRMHKLYEEVNAEDKSLDFIEIIQTPGRVRKRFIAMLMETEKEIMTINRSPYSFMNTKMPEKLLNQQTKANQTISEKGVKTKSITMYEENTWKFFEQELLNVDENEEARVIEYAPIKLSISDRKHVYMRINGVPNQYGGTFNEIIIHDSDFGEACVDLFNSYWDKAYDVKKWVEMKNL